MHEFNARWWVQVKSGQCITHTFRPHTLPPTPALPPTPVCHPVPQPPPPLSHQSVATHRKALCDAVEARGSHSPASGEGTAGDDVFPVRNAVQREAAHPPHHLQGRTVGRSVECDGGGRGLKCMWGNRGGPTL